MMAKGQGVENELELKIRLSQKDLEKVFSALSARIPKEQIRHKYLPRRYYDTVNMDLHKRGVSLRVQYKKGAAGKLGGYEQTVKIDQTPDKTVTEALQRRECKNKLPARSPSIAAVTDPEAIKALSGIKNKSLKHIFTASIERRYFNLTTNAKGQKGTVEIAFDAGELMTVADGKISRFFEIEIERKQGSAKAITAFKKKILALAPSAKVEKMSKAEQGSRRHMKISGVK